MGKLSQVGNAHIEVPDHAGRRTTYQNMLDARRTSRNPNLILDLNDRQVVQRQSVRGRN
jgi:hypothetical protein